MIYQSNSRLYKWWLLTNSLSLIGDQIFQIAFSTAALKAGASISVFTTVATVSAIPRIICLLLASYINSTTASRSVLQSVTFIKILSILGAGVIASFDISNNGELIALSLVMATLESLASPCRVSLLPTIVSKEELSPVAALYQKITILASIIIPLPAGWIIGKLGPNIAFYIVSLSPIGLLFFLQALAPSEEDQIYNGTIRGICNVFIYFPKSKMLQVMIIMLATFTFCVSGPMKIGIAYVAKSSSDPSIVLGAISVASASGGILGIWISKITTHYDAISKVRFCSMTIAPLFIAYAIINSITWFLVFLSFVLGIITSIVNIDTTRFLFSRCGNSLLGALSGTLGIASIISSSISIILCDYVTREHQHYIFLIMGFLLGIISLFIPLYSRKHVELASLV